MTDRDTSKDFKFVGTNGPWALFTMPDDACPCLDHGCMMAYEGKCDCFCHEKPEEKR